MADKMEGYKAETITEDTEIERLETKEPELVPDGETTVPTGDEAVPVSASDPKEARKALYDKARKNRDDLISRETEMSGDVERQRQLVAEAAGGELPAEGIDTNRPSRNDDPDYEERIAAARAIEDEGASDTKPADETHEVEDVNDGASDALPAGEEDATVSVTVLGKEYEVPRQDIDDAGGLAPYQKNRAATIRLQRAATLEQRAQKALDDLEGMRGEQQTEDPSKDGLDEADIDSLREKLLDTVLDGTEDDINGVIEEIATSGRPTPTPTESPATGRPKPSNEVNTDTQEELRRENELDMREANDMMREEYKDIMNDPDALDMAKRHFNALVADPLNEGRTQKELSRESAQYVRKFVARWGGESRKPNEVEVERQTRITRKRKLPSVSAADAPAPSVVKEEKRVPTRREHFMRLRRMQGHET